MFSSTKTLAVSGGRPGGADGAQLCYASMPANPAAAPPHPLRGASLFLAGLLPFAWMDMTTKYLAERYDVPLVWAGLPGWPVFGHVPDALSAAGMAVIAASGLATALKPRRPPAETG